MSDWINEGDDRIVRMNEDNLDNTVLASVIPQYAGSGGVLIWDGVDDYIPSSLKAGTSPKEFRGPTDPETIDGVVLNEYDVWVDTST